jgi:hypothetical protein
VWRRLLGLNNSCMFLQAQEASNSTRSIIFPQQAAAEEDQQTHKMYLQSHKSFEPGTCMRVLRHSQPTGRGLNHGWGLQDWCSYALHSASKMQWWACCN